MTIKRDMVIVPANGRRLIMNVKSILVVDDVYTNRRIIGEIFSDYQVYGASSGDQAREILKGIHPDVILMDIYLPGESGYEITAEIKNRVETKDVPVLFLSVCNTRSDVMQAMKSGGSGFITKPINGRDIRERVERILFMAGIKKKAV